MQAICSLHIRNNISFNVESIRKLSQCAYNKLIYLSGFRFNNNSFKPLKSIKVDD